MAPKFCPLKLYSVELPKRKDWSDSQIKWKEGSLRWYTDGSKSESEVGCGIYAPRKGISLNLGRYCSIFQAEVYAILECVSINLQCNYGNHTIYIHSDSQAALLALTSDVTTSRLVESCRQLLNNLETRNKVVLRWVPGHAGTAGNEKADELARAGAKGKNHSPEPFCGILKSLTRPTLKTYCHYKTIQLWRETTGLNHSKALIKGFSKKASLNALALSRNQLRNLVRVLTEDCGLNKHMYTMGKRDMGRCRLCMEAEETPLHILAECSCLMRTRDSTLGRHILRPEESRSLEIKKILQLFEVSGLDQEL
ncbi:uncharacterized protein LOC133531316 [Cydia pomonella]|uniref:uncharacterized protein LOC133531316 n=1 Tax=Cydia pomonella TaxID=82600 RepID=UPI002ADD6EB0|nr:uncharacterized protein LOC133531316 [Cydia pomonella]